MSRPQSAVEDAIARAYIGAATQDDVRMLADVADRALKLHEHADGEKPFGHGMRSAAKAILGRVPFPEEWNR
jgi:hypothetical protein